MRRCYLFLGGPFSDKCSRHALRPTVKVMVGGAPVTADFARRIGADGHGPNAIDAVDLAKSFMGLH